MPIGDLFKTGDKSCVHAKYKFDHYVDGSEFPIPTTSEMNVSLKIGGIFPPIRSCCKGAYWKLVSYI